MSSLNTNKIITKLNVCIANINRLLKEVKSDILADFIYSDNKEIVIITNKVATASDLNIIEKYIKNISDVDTNDVMSPRLPQLKYYLKILGISYFVEDANLPITLDIVENVIKRTYIFNDTVLVSCS